MTNQAKGAGKLEAARACPAEGQAAETAEEFAPTAEDRSAAGACAPPAEVTPWRKELEERAELVGKVAEGGGWRLVAEGGTTLGRDAAKEGGWEEFEEKAAAAEDASCELETKTACKPRASQGQEDQELEGEDCEITTPSGLITDAAPDSGGRKNLEEEV